MHWVRSEPYGMNGCLHRRQIGIADDVTVDKEDKAGMDAAIIEKGVGALELSIHVCCSG